MPAKRCLLPVLAALLLTFAGASFGGPVSFLGQVVSQDVRLDGVRVPAGTTVLGPSAIASGESPALIELRRGQLLALAPTSEALLTGSAGGGLEVAVRAGRVVHRSAGGEMTVLGKDSLLVLDEEGQIVEGTEVIAPVGMCHLVDWELEKAFRCLEKPRRNQCKWERIEVGEEEVDEHLQLGDVLAGENEIGLDEDCVTGKKAGLPLKRAGMGIAGAILAGVVLGQDGTEPASPIRP